MNNKYFTFGIAAVFTLGGAAMTLDWASIVSAQTAGAIGLVLGGLVAGAGAILHGNKKGG